MEQTAAIWLAAQQRRFTSLAHALVMASADDGGDPPVLASLPAGAGASPALRAASLLVLRQHRPVLRPGRGGRDDRGRARDVVACPLRAGGRLVGAVAIELEPAPAEQQRDAVRRLDEGCAWFEVLLRTEAAALGGRLASLIEITAATLDHDGPREAATALATELANRLGCERVGVGFRRGRRLLVEALSHSASIDARGALARDLADCMREALEHGDTVVWPQGPDGPEAAPAHAGLAARGGAGAGAILSVPLPDGSGAVTLERTGERPFTASEREVVAASLNLAGPVLALKRELHLPARSRIGARISAAAAAVPGSRHLAAKGIALAVLAAATALATVPGDFRISAPATLEGRVQRAVTAAQDGFIASAAVRAGDVVGRGQEMARLEERDLVLARSKWSSRAAQLAKEHRDALANHDRAQVSILAAQREQAAAELALVEEQLARTRLVAPIDGVVLSGDLSQSLGAPVSRGDVLFEVAPLDGYRVVLEVDERDVAHVAAGQQARLALTARPERPLELVVQRVAPVADLRPGMQGIAKVLVGERAVGWIWSRRLVEWLRLAVWRWTP